MKIVIAGAGEVGTHLAKLLTTEHQDILVVDEDAERLDRLDSNFNLMTIVGSPTSFRTLREARVGSCDLFIAVTPSEANNIVACSIAKNLGAKRTVARISSYDFMEDRNQQLVKQMGVDRLIYPEFLAANEIITALRCSWARNWFELHDGQLIVVGVKLRNGAPISGMQLKDFARTNHNFHVSAIKRNQEIIIPRGNDYLREGDIIYIATLRDHVDELLELTGKTKRVIRRIMIMGGSKIAIRFAALAPDSIKIKIIDRDEDTCRRLPEKCPNCEIAYGDARDTDLLRDEGIEDYDAFLALSDSSEANILTCLTAKELGVKKTIAEVENIQYINQAENLNIGTIINKKLLASSTIFQLMLDSDASTSRCLALADAEVAEIEARKGSKIVSKAVRDINFPEGITLAGLVRDGKGMLVTGDTIVQPGDHVVVFTLSGRLHKAEKLFL